MSRSRGFALTEMLFAIVLFAIVGDLAQRVFVSNMKVNTANAQAEAAAARSENILGQMKADVWEAARIESINPHQVRLQSPSGDLITWTIDPASAVERETTSNPSHRWPDVGGSWEFIQTRCGLRVEDTRLPPPRGMALLINEQLWANATGGGGAP